MKCVYTGVMESPSMSNLNGFGKAMVNTFDEYAEIPMSDVNNGIMGLQSADIAFLQPQDGAITAESLKHLKNIGAWICGWSGDCREIIPSCYFEYAKYIDLTCFSNMNDVRTMRSLGYNADFLQIGYDPEIYYPDSTVVKDIPIVFMGNHFGHFPLSNLRREMVHELKKEFGNDFKAFGSGMPDGSYMGDQRGEANIYRRSKIAINLSHFNYERYSSDRLFRTLGSGCCVLSHDYNNIFKDFTPGRELITWTDINDLKQRISAILANEQLRQSIAKCGHELSLKEFTFKRMAENILELYNKR